VCVGVLPDGLVAGYGSTNGTALTAMDFAVLNAIGDFLDLVPALQPSMTPDYDRMTPNELLSAVRGTPRALLSLRLCAFHGWVCRQISNKGHCSALIKVTGNYSDLFAGHSSWFTYSSMLRIFKRYNLNYNNPATATHRVSFSGYPGMLASLDDFYMMKVRPCYGLTLHR
jgi:hypothetical protein